MTRSKSTGVRRSMDTVGFCWIILFAEVAGPVIPRARNLSIRMIEQNPTSERRRSRGGHDAPGIYTRLSYNPVCGHKKAAPAELLGNDTAFDQWRWSDFEEWSGRRDSNSRHPPWQGGALPAELRPHMMIFRPGPDYHQQASCLALVGDTGIEPVTSSVSGKRATAAPIARIGISRPARCRDLKIGERTTRFELATSTLARWCSTS